LTAENSEVTEKLSAKRAPRDFAAGVFQTPYRSELNLSSIQVSAVSFSSLTFGWVLPAGDEVIV